MRYFTSYFRLLLTTFRIRNQSLDGAETPSKTPREDIPWPALDRLSPGNIKKTMSSIMQEWEKSLSPPPGNRTNSLPVLAPDGESANAKEALETAEATRSTQDELVMMSR